MSRDENIVNKGLDLLELLKKAKDAWDDNAAKESKEEVKTKSDTFESDSFTIKDFLAYAESVSERHPEAVKFIITLKENLAGYEIGLLALTEEEKPIEKGTGLYLGKKIIAQNVEKRLLDVLEKHQRAITVGKEGNIVC